MGRGGARCCGSLARILCALSTVNMGENASQPNVSISLASMKATGFLPSAHSGMPITCTLLPGTLLQDQEAGVMTGLSGRDFWRTAVELPP